MTHEEALEKARKGAAFLDEKLGRSWIYKIKRRKLIMEVGSMHDSLNPGCGCILAQLNPRTNWLDGARQLGLTMEDAIELGFVTNVHMGFHELTKAWKQVIREGVKKK